MDVEDQQRALCDMVAKGARITRRRIGVGLSKYNRTVYTGTHSHWIAHMYSSRQPRRHDAAGNRGMPLACLTRKEEKLQSSHPCI